MVDVPLADAPDGVDQAAWKAACSAVRAFCGWHIAPSHTEAITLDGPGSSILRLPSLKVTDVASITNDGTVVTDPEWSEAGMVRGCWSGKFRSVTVTLTHGYELCPDEVLQVVKDMTSAASRVGLASMTAGPFATSPTTAGAEAGAVGVSSEQAKRLAPYRLSSRP